MPTDWQIPAQKHRIGVIDIGSNSVRFVIYEIFGAAFVSVYDEKVLAGLGRDLHITGHLSQAGQTQALQALSRFTCLAGLHGLPLLVGATAALRAAKDAPAFILRVKEETGLDITPLSGEQEALVSALGVLAGESRANGLAADLGGASLELVRISPDGPGAGASFALGPFAVYEGRFEPEKIAPQIRAILESGFLDDFAGAQILYLIGGAWRNLANIHQKRTDYPLRVAHNYMLDASEAGALADWACSPTGIEALLQWPNITKRRAETLPYSGLMLKVLLEKTGAKNIVIAPGGLRDGLVYQSLEKNVKQRCALFDACTSLVGQKQAKFGREIYRFLSALPLCQADVFPAPDEVRIFEAACMLTGVGMGLHPAHRAQIVYEIALYGPLPGLTHKERAFLALSLFRSFRSQKSPPAKRVIDYLLNTAEQKQAALNGSAIRAAIVLSARNPNVLKTCRLEANAKHLSLSVNRSLKPLCSPRIYSHFEALAIGLGLNFHPVNNNVNEPS